MVHSTPERAALVSHRRTRGAHGKHAADGTDLARALRSAVAEAARMRRQAAATETLQYGL